MPLDSREKERETDTDTDTECVCVCVRVRETNYLSLSSERSVKDPRIARAVGVGKKIVAAFAHSWKRQRALRDAQVEMGLPQHKLVTESPTRWGSRQKIIQRLLEQKKAITQVMAAKRVNQTPGANVATCRGS